MIMKTILTLLMLVAGCNIFTENVFSQVKKKPAAATKKPVVAQSSIKPKPKATAIKKPSPVVKPKPPVAKIKPAPETKPAVQLVKPAEVVTLTTREKQMIDEINMLRSNPSAYAGYVNQFLQKFQSDDDTKQAAKELTALLKTLKPLPPLVVNEDMYKDAREYGSLMAQKNIFEHSNLPYNENLSLGYKEIRDAVIDLLIDNGIPTRGHRKNLLATNIKFVAVYELPGKIKDIPYCYVQEFK